MKLNKTFCNLVNFSSWFIAHSLEMGQFLFPRRSALGIFTDRDFSGFEFRKSVFFWVLLTAAVFFWAAR